MNDDSALGAVRDSLATARDSLTDVHMNTPLDDIVRHGRAARRRHMLTGLAGTAVVTIGAALAVITLLPASHQATRSVSARLAAWTVTRQADGDISVTIRELSDPAGLQRRLRADGVPASVRFFPSHHQPNPCQGYDGSQALQHKVAQNLRPGRPRERSTFLIIHPSVLPAGAGVGLQVSSSAGHPHGPGLHQIGLSLVRASPQCTGS
jgi:hypothetical protein